MNETAKELSDSIHDAGGISIRRDVVVMIGEGIYVDAVLWEIKEEKADVVILDSPYAAVMFHALKK